jgi:hypothetical protein
MGWAETVARVARTEQPVGFGGPLSDFTTPPHREQHFRKATTCRRLADPWGKSWDSDVISGAEDLAFQTFLPQRVARFASPNTSADLTRPQRILL